MIITIIILSIIIISLCAWIHNLYSQLAKERENYERTDAQLKILSNWENMVAGLQQSYNELEDVITRNKEYIDMQHKDISSLDKDIDTLMSVLNQKKSELQDFDCAVNNQKIALQESIANVIEEYLQQEKQLRKNITGYEKKIQAYIEEEKRKEEKLNKIDFYRLVLSEKEISDVNRLMEFANTLSFPDILKKLVYKTYFEKKMNDLLGRVVGVNSEVSAIYKITHIESNKIYIGQTTNVKDRWRTHLKRGLGIEAPSTNKFYQSMIELKPWNFTWEIIEFCSKDQLNEQEKYWIDFFQSNSWGWNSKGGNR